jgi:type II secretory pathway pseudopilin PulG
MVNRESGQSLVEVIFAVVIIVLFLTGAVIVLLMSVSARSRGLVRNNATRLAEKVIEDLVNKKANDPTDFWLLDKVSSQIMPNFPDYFKYSVGYSLVSTSSYPNCNVGVTDCVEAIVGVEWTDKTSNYLEVRRFFSRKL